MGKLRTRVFFISIFLSFYQLLHAHVELDYPVGGETFVQGQTVTIQWHISVPHNTLNWDLHFSADAGNSWTPIQLNIPVDQLTYEWLVPDTLTTQGRIRVFMNNSAQDYLDISGDFTIVANTSPPLLDAPASDTVIHCSAQQDADIQSWLNNHGGASATHFCGDLVWTHDYQEITNGCGTTGSAMVSFTATDDCGSTVTIATVTIVDSTSPVIDNPANNMMVECDGTGNQAALSNWLAGRGGAQASDACSDVVWSHDFTALNDACGATGMASVVFTATDHCGNANTTVGEFRIEDHAAPVILMLPQDTTIICGASGQSEIVQQWLGRQGGALASDLCGNVSWTHNFPVLNDSCAAPGTYQITFTAWDDCSNSSTVSANLHLMDTVITSVSFPSHTEIDIYPNPVSDRLTIDFGKMRPVPVQISLTDALGHPVWVSRGMPALTYVPVNGYPSGIYFLQIKMEDLVYTKAVCIP